jgi:hypothetical protein
MARLVRATRTSNDAATGGADKPARRYSIRLFMGVA